LLTSILPTANPGPVFTDLMLTARLTSPVVLDQAVLGALGLMLIATAVRIGFEVRRCRAALTLLVVATFAFLTALIWPKVQLPIPTLISDLVGSSLGMIGVMSLTATSVLSARYVYLDSQGRLSLGREEASDAVEDNEVVEDDESKPISRRSANKRKSRTVSTKEKAVSTKETAEPEALDVEEPETSEPEMYDEEDGESDRRPTKAERRRLRKQRRKAA